MKKLILSLAIVLIASTGFSQERQYQLSTHILDISQGVPAGNVEVKLEKMDKNDETWTFVAKKTTEESGRIENFLPGKDNQGIYRFTFYTMPYFTKSGVKSFYPFVQVVFEINDSKHYHVPITLSAFGYSTYRGS